MTHFNVSSGALLLLMSVTGCGGNMLPPARNSGAVLSDEGVVLAVTGQSCKESPVTNAPNVPNASNAPMMMDAIFSIEVGTSTVDPVIVHTDSFLLTVSGRAAAPISNGQAGETASVEGGTTVPFLLHFIVAGVNCSQEMRLSPSSALEMRGRPVKLEDIRFVPREAH